MKERMEASVEKNNKTITIEVREVSQELEIIIVGGDFNVGVTRLGKGKE